MAELNPEIGKRYWMRYGGITGVLRENENKQSDFQLSDGWKTFKANGAYSGESTEAHKYDIVREFNPAELAEPLRWKRGIPTEDEIRECWIISAGAGEVPMFAPHLSQVQSSARVFLTDIWYIAFRVNPELPKPKPATQMVTLRKWVSPQATGEYIMLRDCDARSFLGWIRTDETVEEPCPPSQS